MSLYSCLCFISLHQIDVVLFTSSTSATGRTHLIYISLNLQFCFEVLFTTSLPQWTKQGFEVWLPDTGSTNNAFGLPSTFSMGAILVVLLAVARGHETDVNNFLLQPVTASVSVQCVFVQPNSVPVSFRVMSEPKVKKKKKKSFKY